MKRSVLIIDDEKDQAEGLYKSLSKKVVNTHFHFSYEEHSILDSIENRYYSLAIVDLRMDKLPFDGVSLIRKIIEINPFAKVVIVSAFTGEYFTQIKDLLITGKVVDVVEKKEFDKFTDELKDIINKFHDQLFADPSEINSALLEFYSQAKNEVDPIIKGERFEHFVSLMFQSIGYNSVNKRVKDKSLNEVDLVIRNEIDDRFLNKFGKYILVECKNKPEQKVDKNTFIVFSSKLKHTNGLSELGVIATTGHITRNTYLEAMRDSHDVRKIIFLSNNEFQRLISSNNRLEDFKQIIDNQVKDN